VTESQRYIRKLTIADPTPVTVPRGVLRSILDNYELLSVGCDAEVHGALVEHMERLVGREWQQNLEPQSNVVPFPPIKHIRDQFR